MEPRLTDLQGGHRPDAAEPGGSDGAHARPKHAEVAGAHLNSDHSSYLAERRKGGLHAKFVGLCVAAKCCTLVCDVEEKCGARMGWLLPISGISFTWAERRCSMAM